MTFLTSGFRSINQNNNRGVAETHNISVGTVYFRTTFICSPLKHIACAKLFNLNFSLISMQFKASNEPIEILGRITNPMIIMIVKKREKKLSYFFLANE
jgi:hypothetical protein